MGRRLTPQEQALRALREEGPGGFRQQVQDAAVKLGWYAYHTHDSRRSTGGFPDLVLVKPPVIIFAELKRQTGAKIRPQQVAVMALLDRCPGVETYWWRPADWDDIIARLRRGPPLWYRAIAQLRREADTTPV